MVTLIKVKSNRPDNKVVLAEKHADHPGGEVFIAGAKRPVLDEDRKAKKDENGQPVMEDNIVEVAETTEVLKALKEQKLVKVDAPSLFSRSAGGQKEQAVKDKGPGTK